MKDNESKKPESPSRRTNENDRRRLNENYERQYSPDQMKKITEESPTTHPEKKDGDN